MIKMEQFEAVLKKRGNNLWITIPKKVIKKEKINLKKESNVFICKNFIILHQN